MIDSLGVGDVLRADRAYDSDTLPPVIGERGIIANIKPMPNRIRRKRQPLQNAQCSRVILEQNQTLSRHCHAIRETSRKR
jgi:hypothetical protein